MIAIAMVAEESDDVAQPTVDTPVSPEDKLAAEELKQQANEKFKGMSTFVSG